MRSEIFEKLQNGEKDQKWVVKIRDDHTGSHAVINRVVDKTTGGVFRVTFDGEYVKRIIHKRKGHCHVLFSGKTNGNDLAIESFLDTLYKGLSVSQVAKSLSD